MPSVLVSPIQIQNKQMPYVDLLHEAGFEIHHPTTDDLPKGNCTEEETIEFLKPFDALLAGGEHITETVAANLPKLRVIARNGVGYDRIDVDAVTRHNIVLAITPTANFDSVAEHTLALLSSAAKFVPQHNQTMRSRWEFRMGQPLRGSTIGIVGLGRIGKAFAKLCLALSMRVIACETTPDSDFLQLHPVQLVSFEELLNQSDFISLHCPLNSDTEHLINQRAFERMKPGSTLINTARGGLVAEADLICALESGHLRAAALDVFAAEPIARDNRLLDFENVICTPHVGSMDSQSSEDMATESAMCVVKLFRGEWPEGAVVNDQLQEGWSWEVK